MKDQSQIRMPSWCTLGFPLMIGAMASLSLFRDPVAVGCTFVFFFMLASLVQSDLDSRTIPNYAVAAIALSGLAFQARRLIAPVPKELSSLMHVPTLATSALAAAALTLALLALGALYRAWTTQEGMGAGDIKLVAALTLWIGPWSAVALMCAFVVAAAVELALAVTRRLRAHTGQPDALEHPHGGLAALRERTFAFGPYLAVAFAVVFVTLVRSLP